MDRSSGEEKIAVQSNYRDSQNANDSKNDAQRQAERLLFFTGSSSASGFSHFLVPPNEIHKYIRCQMLR